MTVSRVVCSTSFLEVGIIKGNVPPDATVFFRLWKGVEYEFLVIRLEGGIERVFVQVWNSRNSFSYDISSEYHLLILIS